MSTKNLPVVFKPSHSKALPNWPLSTEWPLPTLELLYTGCMGATFFWTMAWIPQLRMPASIMKLSPDAGGGIVRVEHTGKETPPPMSPPEPQLKCPLQNSWE